MGNPKHRSKIIKTDDSIMFSGDTGLQYKHINDIISKINTYSDITIKNNLLVNWDKVFILTNNNQEGAKKSLTHYPRP